MRIALLGTAWPMRGGIAQYNAILAGELAKRHEVELVSFTRQYPGFLFPGKSQIDASESVVRFPATALVDSIDPLSWERAARHLRRFKPDALVVKYWMPFFAPAYGWISRRVRPARVISILDNLIPHEPRPFDRALTRWFMGGVDAYITQSRSVRDDLRRLAPGARHLEVPHPVYNIFGPVVAKAEARARLGLPATAPLLLFFGFVRRYKGLDILIEALPAIRAALPAELLVLGEFYEQKEEIPRRIRELGLEGAVRLEDGYVPNEQVGLAFAAADLVVLPYRSATQSGIVPIAWQLERPVLCTGVGGLAEVVQHERTGLIVPSEDPRALADAVVRYYREGLETRFVPAIREEKKKYSWDRMVEAIETLATEPGREGRI